MIYAEFVTQWDSAWKRLWFVAGLLFNMLNRLISKDKGTVNNMNVLASDQHKSNSMITKLKLFNISPLRFYCSLLLHIVSLFISIFRAEKFLSILKCVYTFHFTLNSFRIICFWLINRSQIHQFIFFLISRSLIIYFFCTASLTRILFLKIKKSATF